MRVSPTLIALAAAAFVAAVNPALAANIVRVPSNDASIASPPVVPTGSATLAGPTFGNIATGYAAQRTAVLTNGKNVPVTLTVPSSASVTGTGFSFLSTTCGASLAPAASCDIVIDQSPTTAGTYTGTLTLATSDGAKTAALSAVRGAAAFNLELYPQTTEAVYVHLGKVTIGNYIDTTQTLKNSGNVPATGVYFTPTANSAFNAVWHPSGLNNCAGSTLNPGATCTFVSRYQPLTVGLYFQSHQVKANEGWRVLKWMSGVGTNVVPGITLTGVSVTAPAQVHTYTPATLTNTSGSPFTISSITIQSGYGGVWSGTHNCPASLPTGQSCTITTDFFADAIDPPFTEPGAIVVNGNIASYLEGKIQ